MNELLNEKYYDLDKFIKDNKNNYINANPFPNIVIDDFFDEGFLNNVLNEFPNLSKKQNSDSYVNQNEIKFANFKTSSAISFNGDVYFGIRPEHLTIDKEGPIKVQVEFIELIGSNTLIHCRIQSSNEIIVVSVPGIVEENLSRKEINLNFDQSKIHLFDQKNNMRINQN